MAARTFKAPEPDVVAEVVVKHEPDEQHDKRLDALLANTPSPPLVGMKEQE